VVIGKFSYAINGVVGAMAIRHCLLGSGSSIILKKLYILKLRNLGLF
jgi:hypothetical protein